MKKTDVFISYRRKSNWELGELLYKTLLSEGFHPFFDLEEISYGANFPDRIRDAIYESKDFIILIKGDDLVDCDTIKDDWVLKEIEYALDFNCNIIPLFSGEFNKDVKNEKIKEILKRNGLKISHDYFAAAMKVLRNSLISVPEVNTNDEGSSEEESVHEKIENKYDTVRFRTQERLSVQQKILKPYNDKIFERLLENKKDIDVLDIGSNNGNTIMTSVIPEFDIKHIIGLDCSEKMYQDALKYVDVTPYKPYLIDVEAENFVDRLKNICEENNIEGFDLIVCSFVLLHLKKPGTLIRKIRKFLKPDGYLFIRDVDDLQIVSYPDPKHIVKTFKDIDGKLAHTGYRRMARELYTHLKQAEYRNIEIIGEDVSTVGRDYYERMELMDMNFSYIKENVVDMIVPDKPSKFDGYLTWVEGHYDDLENLFADSTYYFKVGLVAIIAKR
ncbi:MAG: methyltransferase domain-containing protein [Bacilli bacterium]|nr:methyltransferase domain-containing protein [Bacilli bacterium]